ncbi:efflux RND transporter permease subunit [Embleya sp. NPDC050154]|uniref:MMPL family transporter n=1 Tax=Embleya sp. NPDC050154 TaxID=3363988 RepID=UPI0037B4B940
MLDTIPVPPPEHEVSHERPPGGALNRLAGWCVRHRRWLLVGAMIVLVLAATVVAGARDRWSNGGFTATGTQAAEAERVAARYGAKAADLVLYVRADTPVDDAAVAETGRRLTATVAGRPGVREAQSYWSTGSTLLRSRDGHGALIRVDLTGSERDHVATSRSLVPAARKAAGDGLRVSATGPAWLNAQATDESERDLKRGELLAAPLTMIILLLAFGSLTAAAIPLAVGAVSVAGALAVLATLTLVMPITVFAINICAALGFALSVDYALFIVTRYREELSRGADSRRAITRSMATAGRAVLFSAATVALCLSALFVFPLELLRSLAWASILVVIISALTSLLVLPALLAVLGPRLDRLDPFRRFRRGSGRVGGGSPLWRRIATVATARPILCGGAAAVLLLVLALPFLHARFTTVDETILPTRSEPHATANLLRTDFADPPERIIPVVLPRANAATDGPAIDAYARRLSALPHVAHVLADTGDYRAGLPVPGPQSPPASNGPQSPSPSAPVIDVPESPSPSTPAADVPAPDDQTRVVVRPVEPPAPAPPVVIGSVLRVVSTADSQAPETVALVHTLRTLPAPQPHLVAGKAAELTDTKHTLREALPYGAGIMLIGTLVMLFLFTRSVLVPIKAVLMGLLSITASLGAIVYVFQDGHLRWLVGDFSTNGSLETTMPLLTLAVAFGISVDYEVFLLARIKEEFVRTGDNTRSIVFGIEHTGRLFTAAALIVAATMVALTMSNVTLLKTVGVGLAVAVVVDATVVRGILVPALMRLTGRANWWAPTLPRRRPREIGAKLPDARAEACPELVGQTADSASEGPDQQTP